MNCDNCLPLPPPDRIMPEDVTINCDNCLPPPICTMPGRAWDNIVHDDTVNWLGFYKQETDDKVETKYMQMDKTSEAKTKPDYLKYERARKLVEVVPRIRKDYQLKIAGGTMFKQQLGTCAYFVDRMALRVGGEKNTDEEADTVGCCSLRVEHMNLDFDAWKAGKPQITLDFLGKDSIRYLNTVPVPKTVFKALVNFIRGKKPTADLFDQIVPSVLNEYFQVGDLAFIRGLVRSDRAVRAERIFPGRSAGRFRLLWRWPAMLQVFVTENTMAESQRVEG